ncbi:uncharacterized protein LOC119998971 isoform X2 [Tripterygium wilfordii]|uniref:uncharacterized protein LOC119998971 isoform X2 n=1 Tax=Tripterygium wilfordii TaxID=458696 RepID=UPI0018F7FFE3|nr:uncharacterized protein LOC119998971 isoform X2 [Tripterygium wilfordii]
MDESWRMRMGMPDLPRRRSTEEASRRSVTETVLDADDFSDVFGGPPRTVLTRKFSGDFCAKSTSSSSGKSFYEDVFRPPESDSKSSKSGRSLPAFRIPSRNEGFYGDVFRWDDDQMRSRERSRSDSKAKSKSNSSSVLSSEELSPLRPVLGDDVALNSFASKLRPINVPGGWNAATKMSEEKPNKQATPVFQCNPPSPMENQYMESESNNFKSSYYGFSRRNSSPETISIEPNSYGSFKVSGDDVELNSPASPVSSLCQETEATGVCYNNSTMPEQEMDQEEDEVMSSYVIEINSDHKETTGEAVSVDEAIAWAKERFQRQSTERQEEKDQSTELGEMNGPRNEFLDQEMNGHEMLHSSMEEQKKWTTDEEKEQSEKDQLQMEMDLLNEDVRLWSAGKEINIQSLLSTLHHILWPSSGWYPITLTSLTESSNVKKAYQRARLCLHPDKLQQRGATLQQKYVAEKAFSILQDAWATFISQDVFFNY